MAKAMTITYTVTDILVSDANPSETALNWCENVDALAANRAIACILDNIENTPASNFAPEFDARTVRFVIEVTRHI